MPTRSPHPTYRLILVLSLLSLVSPLAAPAGATSYAATGPALGALRYLEAHPVAEGATSPSLAGSQATSPAGEINCNGAGGPWSATSTWSGGILPSATDNVTIDDGCTVTVDTSATINNLTVGQGASGVLEFEATTARTLTINGSVTIASGGIFQSAATGTATTHLLSVGADLVNNGTLDFSTNGNTAGAELRFVNATNNTMSGTGTTTDLRLLSISKGSGTITTSSPVLEITIPFTVRGAATTDTAGFLSTAPFNGIVEISGTFTYSSVVFQTPAYSIPSTGGFWLSNPDFTVAGLNGSPTMNGLLRVSDGAYNVGASSDNAMGGASSAKFIVEGGTLNLAGRLLTPSAVTYTQSGGTVNVTTVGNTASSSGGFDLSSAAASFTMSGGTIVLVQASTGATPLDYRVAATSPNITGGALQVGENATATNFNFRIAGAIPNLVVDNTATDKTATLFAAARAYLNATIDAGATLDLDGFTFTASGNVTNNGTLTGAIPSSRLVMAGSSATSFTNSGTVTTPLDGLSIDNPAGVTLTGNPFTTLRVNLLRGLLSGSSLLTLGNGGGTSAITQIGSAGLASAGGSYAAAPTFNSGAGGVQVVYLQEGVARSTGLEIPASRSVASLSVVNTNGVTLAGGGLTLTGVSGLTLTAGKLNTSASNMLTLASTVTAPPTGSAISYVNGPLTIEVNTATNTSRTFAVGDAAGWRPVVLGDFHSNGALQPYTVSIVPGSTGGTPGSPLVALTTARYYRLQNTANIFSATTATVQLSYGADDNVGAPATARVAQATTPSGAYTSRGGAAQATPTAGIVSTTAIVQGDDYFVLANEQALPTTWDGGAGTSNWGDAGNWNPDGVPSGTTDVNLVSNSTTAIDVDGAYAVNALALNSNVSLGLGSNALAVNGAFSQGGGTLNLGNGTLEVKGDFNKTGGVFTPNTGTTLFSGTAPQAINCSGVTFYNLTLAGGGAGNAKTFTAGSNCTINRGFAVASTAQLALSAATATAFSIGGNLSYGGVAGGANVGSLTFNLTGVGRTIGGAALEAPTPVQAPDYSRTPVQQVNFLTDAGRFESKEAVQFENTYAQRQAEVERLLADKSPDSLLIITLDDRTLVQNPAWIANLAPRVGPSFEMNVTVASGASYTLLDNVAIGTGRTLTVNGRLDAVAYTLSGGGLVSVTIFGILGTAQPTGGVGATVLTTGANVYSNGSIVEYNAAGDQVVDALSHPANSMIQTGGSGVKTLNGNKTITGSSGSVATKGMIYVKAGTTFADGGYTVSAAGSYANVVVLGGYQSTGTGGMSYEASPYGSTILAVDGTIFGDLTLNFNSSTNAIFLRPDTVAGTSTITFRNITFGGSAGTGTAGGTLQVNNQGTTPVVVIGDVNLAPATVANTGGGFGGTGSTVGSVTVGGNIVSTSTAATQPIFNNMGTNTLIVAGTSPQTIDVAADTTILTGATLEIGDGGEVSLAPVSGAGRTYKLGGNLTVAANGVFRLGQNALFVEGAVANDGMLVQTLAGPLAGPTSFLTIQNALATTTKYYGLDLIPTSPPFTGDTTVVIAGNQQCLQVNDTTVQRCYEVTPASPQPANIKFYFSETEMAPTGQPLSNQNVWNYHAGNWNGVTRSADSGTCTSGAIDCFVQGDGISTYSPFAVSPSVALAVTLAGFGAQPRDGQVLVTWETAAELNNVGFNLYRAGSAGAAGRTMLAFVPSQSPGAAQGASYSYADADVSAGQTYTYWLEDLDISGAAVLHGPVSATANAPTAVNLTGFGATAAPLTALPPMLPLAAGLAAAFGSLAGLGAARRRGR